MATVTKLKAAVNNKNLPILGEDGNLYNYYYGRWINKVSEFGYAPRVDVKNALNAFVESGINNGWIDRISYFLPFVGSQTNPKAGFVPLIDNLSSNYEINEYDETDANIALSFSYDSNGNIISYGATPGVGEYKTPIVINLPFLKYKGISVLTEMKDFENIDANNFLGNYVYIDNETRTGMMGFRKSLPAPSGAQFVHRHTPSDESLDTQVSIGNELIAGSTNVVFGISYFYDASNTKRQVRFCIADGVEKLSIIKTSTIEFSDLSSISNSMIFGIGADNLKKVFHGKMKSFIIFDPNDITKDVMNSMITAMSTLNTALGR
jgi:hypothetical protein